MRGPTSYDSAILRVMRGVSLLGFRIDVAKALMTVVAERCKGGRSAGGLEKVTAVESAWFCGEFGLLALRISSSRKDTPRSKRGSRRFAFSFLSGGGWPKQAPPALLT
jgi:hypothetical protein